MGELEVEPAASVKIQTDWAVHADGRVVLLGFPSVDGDPEVHSTLCSDSFTNLGIVTARALIAFSPCLSAIDGGDLDPATGPVDDCQVVNRGVIRATACAALVVFGDVCNHGAIQVDPGGYIFVFGRVSARGSVSGAVFEL